MTSSSPQRANVNERMIERIDNVLATAMRFDLYGLDDKHILKYVRGKLTPEAVEARGESEGESVTHLIEVAKMRLGPYERDQ